MYLFNRLCIGPSGISINEFFTSFYLLLTENSYVSDIVCIPTAYIYIIFDRFVPVMKFKYLDVSIDMLYIEKPYKMNLKSSSLDITDLQVWEDLPYNVFLI